MLCLGHTEQTGISTKLSGGTRSFYRSFFKQFLQQFQVLQHQCDPSRMYGEQISIGKAADEVFFSCIVDSCQSLFRPAMLALILVCRELITDFPDHSREGPAGQE